jgi:hypothetical protein
MDILGGKYRILKGRKRVIVKGVQFNLEKITEAQAEELIAKGFKDLQRVQPEMKKEPTPAKRGRKAKK